MKYLNLDKILPNLKHGFNHNILKQHPNFVLVVSLIFDCSLTFTLYSVFCSKPLMMYVRAIAFTVACKLLFKLI